MAQRVLQVEYESGELVVRISPKEARLLPQSVREHLKAANREALLALRGCLDSAIDLLERSGESEPSSRRTRIPVEEVEEEGQA